MQELSLLAGVLRNYLKRADHTGISMSRHWAVELICSGTCRRECERRDLTWLDDITPNVQGVDAERMIHVVVIFELDGDRLTHSGGNSVHVKLDILRFNRYRQRWLSRIGTAMN